MSTPGQRQGRNGLGPSRLNTSSTRERPPTSSRAGPSRMTDEERLRARKFTPQENLALAQAFANKYNYLRGHLKVSKSQRDRIWEQIRREVNAVNGVPRNMSQIKKRVDDIMRDTKRALGRGLSRDGRITARTISQLKHYQKAVRHLISDSMVGGANPACDVNSLQDEASESLRRSALLSSENSQEGATQQHASDSDVSSAELEDQPPWSGYSSEDGLEGEQDYEAIEVQVQGAPVLMAASSPEESIRHLQDLLTQIQSPVLPSTPAWTSARETGDGVQAKEELLEQPITSDAAPSAVPGPSRALTHDLCSQLIQLCEDMWSRRRPPSSDHDWALEELRNQLRELTSVVRSGFQILADQQREQLHVFAEQMRELRVEATEHSKVLKDISDQNKVIMLGLTRALERTTEGTSHVHHPTHTSLSPTSTPTLSQTSQVPLPSPHLTAAQHAPDCPHPLHIISQTPSSHTHLPTVQQPLTTSAFPHVSSTPSTSPVPHSAQPPANVIPVCSTPPPQIAPYPNVSIPDLPQASTSSPNPSSLFSLEPDVAPVTRRNMPHSCKAPVPPPVPHRRISTNQDPFPHTVPPKRSRGRPPRPRPPAQIHYIDSAAMVSDLDIPPHSQENPP